MPISPSRQPLVGVVAQQVVVGRNTRPCLGRTAPGRGLRPGSAPRPGRTPLPPPAVQSLVAEQAVEQVEQAAETQQKGMVLELSLQSIGKGLFSVELSL